MNVQAVRMQVRGVRTMRQVDVARDTGGVDQLHRAALEELMEMPECPSIRRRLTRPAGLLLHPAERGGQKIRADFERIRRRSFRHAARVEAEVIAHRDAKLLVATHANRRPRAGPVETEKWSESIPRRCRPRRMCVAYDVQGERLIRPLRWSPDPGLGPVLDRHLREIRH